MLLLTLFKWKNADSRYFTQSVMLIQEKNIDWMIKSDYFSPYCLLKEGLIARNEHGLHISQHPTRKKETVSKQSNQSELTRELGP